MHEYLIFFVTENNKNFFLIFGLIIINSRMKKFYVILYKKV